MRASSFPSLLFMVAVVACSIGLIIAEEKTNSLLPSQDDISASDLHTTRDLQTAHKNAEGKDEDEERGSLVNRLKKLVPKGLRSNTKTKEVNINKEDAKESMAHLNGIMSSGDAGKLTKPKVEAIEKYAKDNPEKWDALEDMLIYLTGFGTIAFLVYGAVHQMGK